MNPLLLPWRMLNIIWRMSQYRREVSPMIFYKKVPRSDQLRILLTEYPHHSHDQDHNGHHYHYNLYPLQHLQHLSLPQPHYQTASHHQRRYTPQNLNNRTMHPQIQMTKLPSQYLCHNPVPKPFNHNPKDRNKQKHKPNNLVEKADTETMSLLPKHTKNAQRRQKVSKKYPIH